MTTRPKILFLHRNSVGQFEFFGQWLAQNGWEVTFAMGGQGADQAEGPFQLRYFPLSAAQCPPSDFRYPVEFAAQNAASAATWMTRMRDEHGYAPNIVMAHVGWGVGLCVKQVWPRCRYVAYHEWYYSDHNWAEGGRIERPADVPTMVVNRLRTLPITAEFDSADENWCPTEFQAGRFPPALRPMLSVVPDGVDCTIHKPDPEAQIDFAETQIPSGAPILTYATRGMEPVRGFPQFMRALSVLQHKRPELHAVIVANDRVSYGPQLPQGASWRDYALEKYGLDADRIHFFPMLPRAQYLKVLQASTAHVYFTEPFVTSWSLAEALAAGCLVIGSLTGPVEEFVKDMESGILVDMDDPAEVADMVEWVLDHPAEAAKIRRAARAQVQQTFGSAHVFPMKEARLRRLLS